MVIVCWICYNFAGTSLKRVIRHISSVHSHDANFRVLCGINCCPRVYTKFSSFKKHLYRHHKAELHDASFLRDTTGVGNSEYDVPVEDIPEEHFLVDNEVDAAVVLSEKKVGALFLLKMKEVHKMSQTALCGLISDVNDLIQYKVKSVETEVLSYLASVGVSSDHCTELRQLFQRAEYTPFTVLGTKYLQEKYYREHLGLLVSL